MPNKRNMTPQELAWSGEFGDQYTVRCADGGRRDAARWLWRRALALATGIESIIEIGPNTGHNLLALREIIPNVELAAVEINPTAREALSAELADIEVHPISILDFEPQRAWDLVIAKQVLIHIPPEWIWTAYDKIYQCTNRWIAICEYYNPTPVNVSYRGKDGMLVKRDFCNEIMMRHPDLRLRDYAFVYHMDIHPQDDVTWWLLEKTP